jgi:hypothetical protein
MKKSFVAGIALGLFTLASASVLSAPASHAAEMTAAKKALMEAIDKCEMQQKTDARESCMDDAWAAYKKAAKK